MAIERIFLLWHRMRYAIKSPVIRPAVFLPLLTTRAISVFVAGSHSKLIAPGMLGAVLCSFAQPGFRPDIFCLSTVRLYFFSRLSFAIASRKLPLL